MRVPQHPYWPLLSQSWLGKHSLHSWAPSSRRASPSCHSEDYPVANAPSSLTAFTLNSFASLRCYGGCAPHAPLVHIHDNPSGGHIQFYLSVVVREGYWVYYSCFRVLQVCLGNVILQWWYSLLSEAIRKWGSKTPRVSSSLEHLLYFQNSVQLQRSYPLCVNCQAHAFNSI